jgi:hypothetical protein
MKHIIKYPECRGCHTYKEYVCGCRNISTLHKYCPCQTCLIKCVCNTVCKSFYECNERAYMERQNKTPFGLNCG